jgi:very-short-patch-repair endonuclease
MNDNFLYNNKVLKDRRKELRNNPTETEAILWNHLRNRKLGGFKFSRQYSAGPYILDFYCHKIRLAIELDGSQHNKKENVLYDLDRDHYLKSINIKTIRFWNNEVVKNIDMVLNKIHNQASRMSETPS